MAITLQLGRRPRLWGLIGATLLASAGPASAQLGYGGAGYGGYGYGGYGYAPGYGGFGSGGFGYGGGYGAFGFPGYGVAVGSPGFVGSYGGYPLQSPLNAYNLGYGNTLGIGLVPPAFVGTGTAGIGYPGIGGTNPLFGLGLSPLAIHNAVAEQNLRLRYSPYSGGYYRGYGGNVVRQNFLNTRTLPNSFTNETIPNAVSAVPR